MMLHQLENQISGLNADGAQTKITKTILNSINTLIILKTGLFAILLKLLNMLKLDILYQLCACNGPIL